VGLDAIARSDGSRSSMLAALPDTRVETPVGPTAFDADGRDSLKMDLGNKEAQQCAGLLRGAAEGTRTLDLLHGKRKLSWRGQAKLPANGKYRP